MDPENFVKHYLAYLRAFAEPRLFSPAQVQASTVQTDVHITFDQRGEVVPIHASNVVHYDVTEDHMLQGALEASRVSTTQRHC